MATGCAAGGTGAARSGIPVNRYSTARSGLLNAARSAATHMSRSKPMAIMLPIVSSSALPLTREDAPEAVGVGAPASGAGAAAGGTGVVSGAGVGVGGGAAGAGTGTGGFTTALAFCCITTTNEASVTPASAKVVVSTSTFPLCTNTIVSTANCVWLATTSPLTSPIESDGSRSTSNLAFVLFGGGWGGRESKVSDGTK